MSSNVTSASKLAFSSQCLPGSVAEQKEKERLAEFQRSKAMRQAQEAKEKPELDAQREATFQSDREANQKRMKDRAASRARKFIMP